MSNNPKDLLGIKKVQLNLVPPSSIIYEALAFGDGAKKYGPYNWRSNKVIASIYIAALMRHVLAWYDGEDNANDSGLHHFAHAKACLGVLIDAMTTGNLIDDRPPEGKASLLLDAFKENTEDKKEDILPTKEPIGFNMDEITDNYKNTVERNK